MSKNAIRPVVFGVLILASSSALYNVYADNSEVTEQAEQVACPEGCVKLIRLERSPFGQSFEFQNSIEHQTTARVECTRKWVLVGEYTCE